MPLPLSHHPDAVFLIERLACAYATDAPAVLEIDFLELRRGQVTAFVGASGAGKTTLLETLGLMNNTIRDGHVYFYPKHAHAPIDFSEVWTSGGETLTKLRRQYMSFIFQDTNLMPNFSGYENACLPLLLQGYSWIEAQDKVKVVMQEVGLGESELMPHEKNVPIGAQRSDKRQHQALSTGQRQRLAFVRAITSDFEVLFGDEPTGNLDPKNARGLMRMVKTAVIDRERTSILVSHDIGLMLDFADQIVVISKSDEKETGHVKQEHIFQRQPAQQDMWQSRLLPNILRHELQQIIETNF